MKEALRSPFVPVLREYPSKYSTRRSAGHVRVAATAIMGHNAVWGHHLYPNHFLTDPMAWGPVFENLKSMTPRQRGGKKVSALRVRLPESWDLDLTYQTINFIESTTGVMSKLRTSPYFKGGSILMLRGWRETLAKAADELLAISKDVQIFELGEVSNLDYESRQLWPRIPDALGDGTTLDTKMRNGLWVHGELTEELIETRYEDIPKPSEWTAESLEAYISKIVCSRIYTDRAVALYGQPKEVGTKSTPTRRGLNRIDTEGIRVRLIRDTMMDPAVKSLITPSMLNMALVFMSQRGGHRASASKLFQYAEEQGSPVDTDTYNILLKGYVLNREVRFFYKLLRRMRARYIRPNAQTWLLFMQLLQRAEHRNQVAAAMWENGMFDDPTVRRSIASIMVNFDAYSAFRTGMTMKNFLDSREARYGKDWQTAKSMRGILEEYLGFYGSATLESKTAAILQLMDRQLDDGDKVRTNDVNIILSHCEDTKDWAFACWALTLLDRYGCQANESTYRTMIDIAYKTSRPRALGVVLYYAILDRKFNFQSRLVTRSILSGASPSNVFWRFNQPYLFDETMLGSIMPGSDSLRITEPQLVSVIRSACDGYTPVSPLPSIVDTVLHLDSDSDPKPAQLEFRNSSDPEAPSKTITLTHSFEWFTKLLWNRDHGPSVYSPEETHEPTVECHQELASYNTLANEILVTDNALREEALLGFVNRELGMSYYSWAVVPRPFLPEP